MPQGMNVPKDAKCVECQSDRLNAAAIPGLLACQNCGKVQPMPRVLGVAEGDDTSDEWCSVCKGDGETETILGMGKVTCQHCDGSKVEPKKKQSGLVAVDAAEMPEAPDAFEEEEGFRAWIVKKRLVPGEIPMLRSVTVHEAFWQPGAPMKAVCSREDEKHTPPHEHCSCGLYTAKTLKHLLSMPYHRYDEKDDDETVVLGRVKLWGKVIEGTQGWRAEFGYPSVLYVPFESWRLIDPLREAYRVPVAVKNWADKLEKKINEQKEQK